jgi:endonuclease/exonuclease/phosphatase family metal-dependent hydrolase
MRLLTVDARVTGRDRAALARLIEDADVDIACVHRAPHQLRWRSISAALGRRSGLVVVGGGRGAGANLLLSTLGVDSLLTTDVPLGRGLAGAALASLRVGGTGGTQFVLAGARLSGSAAHRAEQAHNLRRALDRFLPAPLPTVLCVDGADGAAADVLRSGRRELGAGVFVDEDIAARGPTALDGPAAAGVAATVELSIGATARR